ncbi:MAG: VWA domain-containing protein [Gammaproteobacteria bacterium]|nr:VWA domain-containing protein [Gammaproteobacteria bacterium]
MTKEAVPSRQETEKSNVVRDALVPTRSDMPQGTGEDKRRPYASRRRTGGRGLGFGAFLRSQRGGAMVIGGVLGVVAMMGAGSAMVNHSWREAQSEELQAALRAAISSAAPVLAGDKDEAKERIVGFATGAMPGLDVDTADVEVAHDPSTKITEFEFSGGTYAFTNLFGPGGEQDVKDALPKETIKVIVETDRYEVAIALDMSRSMLARMSDRTPKFTALKSAMAAVVDAMQSTTEATTGRIAVSLIPFTSAVKVADTAGSGQTPGKERYLRMLAGTPASGETITDTLRAAKDAAGEGWGHWVDGFHHYGVGADLGALRKRSLPDALLDGTDWNLRRTDVAVDVSEQVPKLDTGGEPGEWVVDDEDFWNGCVMARWGAYWDPDARPDGWSPPGDADNWPYRKEVPSWSPKGFALAASATPLHLSDAPPDADDTNTLFTAYSWPDARVGGTADHRLQTVMATLLAAPDTPKTWYYGGTPLDQHLTSADNIWRAQGSPGGKGLCPDVPILALNDDFDAFKQAIANLKIDCGSFPNCLGYTASDSMTYLPLGIVWGLRTLSPLWQRVWKTSDQEGNVLPAVNCAEGDSDDDCDPKTRKLILIVTDGLNNFGPVRDAMLTDIPTGNRNPGWHSAGRHCASTARLLPSFQPYHDAAEQDTQANFDAKFSDYLDDANFGGARIGDVVDAFRALDRFTALTPAQHNARRSVLEGLTPWRLFRTPKAEDIDKLMDEANAFGFDNRPVQMEHFCEPTSMFGPYGRMGDAVYVGDSESPRTNVAPFGIPTDLATRADYREKLNRSGWDPNPSLRPVLDDWFLNACRNAEKRGVHIIAIYLRGLRDRGWRQGSLLLEQCVDAAGGDPNQNDVYVATDPDHLRKEFEKRFQFAVRNVRFLD